MNAGPVRVGLLGCGWIAEIAHVPTLERSRVGRLVAAADPDPARRAWLATRAPAARLHSVWEALLDDPAVDAVIVALPTALHADAACAAFAAGKHVFLEKPLALTLADGRRVVDGWRRAGTAGAIGYNFRRNPNVARAARELATGALGDLVAIQGSFQWAAPRIEGWRARPEAGGGALIDLVSHHVDLVGALTGDRPARVQCILRTVRAREDTAAVQLTTESGVTVQLLASSAAGAPVNRLDLVGSTGRMIVDLLDPGPSRIEQPPARGARVIRGLTALAGLDPRRLLRSPGWEPSFAATLDAFLAAVQAGADPAPDLADGLRTLAVIEAASASARRAGQPVAVEAGA